MKSRKETKKIPRGIQKTQFPYSLVNCEKFRSTMNWEKYVFNLETHLKPIGKSAYITEFLTVRKFDLLTFYQKNNVSTSSTSLNKHSNDFMVNL